MPIGVNNIELLRYFRQPDTAFGKSVQRSWTFWGFFMYNPFSTETKVAGMAAKTYGLDQFGKKLFSSLNKDFPPIIQPFHILSVTVPTYGFTHEMMMYGQVPKSYPILDFKSFEFSTELEEDEQGTVDYFINWNQRRIIDSDGYYNAPDKVKIPGFVLEVQDKMGIPVIYYIFHDIFFLNADGVTYAYNSVDSIKRTITWACDRLSHIYVKQNAVAAVIGAAAGAGALTKDLASSTVGLTKYLGRKLTK